MRVALITGRGSVEIRDMPEPVAVPGAVVVDIAGCGICGTDLHAYQSGEPYSPTICGHEWFGHISAVGSGVRRLGEGDRVVVAVSPPCGRCAPCRSGRSDHCATSFAGAVGRDPLASPHGGFAPRLACAADRVVACHPGLSDVEATQVEPATVTLHAVRRSGLRIGDIAVIQGAGPIGLLTLQWVRAGGAGEVIVVEPSADRRALALDLGASLAVEPGESAIAAVRDRTKGLGADIVYECVGSPMAIQAAVDLARRGGEMCLIGVAHGEAPILAAAWLVKEITVTSGIAYAHHEFGIAMGMMADGRIRVAPLVSRTVGLDNLAATFAALATGQSSLVKVLVDPR